MTERERASQPVWVWLPGALEPVRCGTFDWRAGLGEFIYDPEYLARVEPLPLDPVSLPLSRSLRPHRTTSQRGLHGVLRDASPEGYGLQLLEDQSGRELDPLERLEAAAGDAVGAVAVCHDIEAKVVHRPPELAEVLDRLARGYGLTGLGVPTALGGERPKLTVLHRGQQWIAKLQSSGDPPHAPLREHLAMRCARASGIDAAETEFFQAGGCEVVAVRRFDRHVRDDGSVMRYRFASAHTVLQLGSASVRGDPRRSYLAFASALRRWCKPSEREPTSRELWRRAAFNAIVGNGDDHPRNHGIVSVDGMWRLSPAYDIAPYIVFGGTLAMAITADGSASATLATLMRACEHFGLQVDAAKAFLDEATERTQEMWRQERIALGLREANLPAPRPLP